MDITTLYKPLGHDAGWSFDEKGVTQTKMTGVTTTIKVDNKVLTLPTSEFLRNPDWKEFVAFHPLCENNLRGESQVLRTLRNWWMIRLNGAFVALLEGLITIAADTDGHKRLGAKASEFLSVVKGADEKTVKAMNKILDVACTSVETRLVSCYLKRGGEWQGDRYNRVCVIDFPVLSAIDVQKQTIFDAKVARKGDFNEIQALIKWVLGLDPQKEVPTENPYTQGTNDMTAPYLTSFLSSMYLLGKRINHLVKLYKKHIPDLAEFEYDLSWHEHVPNFKQLSNLLPAYEGNVGVVPKDESTGEVANAPSASGALARMAEHQPQQAPIAQQAAPAPAPVPQPAPAPQYHTPAPAPTHQPPSPTSFAAKMAAMRQPPAPAPQTQYQHPHQNRYAPPAPQYPQQPQQPQSTWFGEGSPAPMQPQHQAGPRDTRPGAQPQYQHPHQQQQYQRPYNAAPGSSL